MAKKKLKVGLCPKMIACDGEYLINCVEMCGKCRKALAKKKKETANG